MATQRSTSRHRVVVTALAALALTAGLVGSATAAGAQGAPEVGGNPDVTIALAVDQTTVVAGDPIDYHVTVVNTGDVTLTGLTVLDPKAPDCAGPIADLAPTADVTIDCSYTTIDPDDVGTRTNKAAVTSNEGALALSDPVTTTVEPPTSELTLTKSADQTAVVAGDPIDYHVQVENTGNQPLTNVAVTDVNASDCDTAVGALAPDASTTIDCSYTTTGADEGTYSNVASATSDQTASTDSNQVDVTVAAEDFALSATMAVDQASVTAGDDLDYHLTIENIGNRPVTGITVVDANVPDCDGAVADLAPGAQTTVDCTYTTVSPGDVGTYTNSATVSSNEAPEVETDEVSSDVVAQDPSITIVQTVDQQSVFASQDIDLHLELENTGNTTLTGVTIIDLKAPDCAGPVPDLAAGASTTIDCSYTTVLADGGTYKNTAAVDTAQTPLLTSNQIRVTVRIPTCGNEPVNISIAEGDVPTAGHDVILGTTGPDTINSLGGVDFVCALGGDDVLNGGPGDDLLVGMNGDDTINGGSGGDFALGDLDFGSGTPGNDTINVGDGNDYVDAGGGNDQVQGGPGADQVVGRGGTDTIHGGDGDDSMSGSNGNDTMTGDAGIDQLFGNAGDDTQTGGTGNDVLQGGGSDDVVSGDSGNDVILGQDGNDTLHGGTGNDQVEGGAGTDVATGDDNEDVLRGDDGNDELRGGNGNDVVFGDAQNDKLFGDAGIDRLYGGSGNDRLSGGTGSDGCFGDSGTDVGDASCESRLGIP